MEEQAVRPKVPRPPSIDFGVKQIVDTLKSLHDEVYLYVDQALSADERDAKDQAIVLYRKGVDKIQKALQLDITDTNKVASQWEKCNKIIVKLKQTQIQIESRLRELVPTTDLPPSYEESMTPSSMTPSCSYDADLAASIMDDVGDEFDGTPEKNASTLVHIQSGVQIFFVTPEGYVSAPSYPSSLGIYKFKETRSEDEAPAFLKVGDWTYPLVPGCSPALQSNWGAYMFPDPNVQGQSCGVLLPDNVSSQVKNAFENILNEYSAMRVQAAPSAPVELNAEVEAVPSTPVDTTQDEETGSVTDPTGVKIAKGLVTAAEWLSWGVGKGAKATGKLISKGSEALRHRLTPTDEPRHISEDTQRKAYYAKKATSYGVQVSSYVVTKVGDATMMLAKQLAPHVKEHGSKLLPKSLKEKNEASGASKVDTALQVAAGGLKGWAIVYMGLEAAAQTLCESVAKETVDTVEHKYGPEAGKFAGNTVSAVGNAGQTMWTVRQLGAKAIAKRVIKDTGKTVVLGPEADQLNNRNTQQESNGHSYPPQTSQGDSANNYPPRPPPPSTKKTQPK